MTRKVNPDQIFLHGQQHSYGALLRFMQPYDGTLLLDGHFPVDLFLQHARLYPAARQHLPGRPRDCHHNALHFAQGHPERTVITGLALYRGLWVSHSWLEENGETIETTPLTREQYLGFPTPASELFNVLKGESSGRFTPPHR